MNPQETNLGQKAQEKTGQIADQAREKTGELAQQAQDTAKTTLQQQKGRVAGQVDTLAQALHQTGQHLQDQDQGQFGQVAHQAADRLEKFADDLQNKSVDEMFNDVQDFARRDPQLFLGGAVVLGLLAARFLKSSSERRQQQSFQGGQYPSRYSGRYSSGTYRQQRPGGYYTRQDLNDYGRDAMDDEYTGSYRGSSYGARGTGFSSTPGLEDESGFAGERAMGSGEDLSKSDTQRGYSTGKTGSESFRGGTSESESYRGDTTHKSEGDPFTGRTGEEPRIPPYPGSTSRTNE